MQKRVVVLGGGVAGLTVAHELAQRGFAVTVYERMTTPGGKARSIPDPRSGTNERADRPGEHGFRFFPAFYRHVIDTMQRIPFQQDGRVAQNLTYATRVMMARFGAPPNVGCAGFPKNLSDLWAMIHSILQGDGVSLADNLHFIRCLLVMMTSCQQRFNAQYEYIPYWTFIDAENRPKEYRDMLGQGLTRSLVAMQAQLSSTRTVATVFCQMIYPMFDPTAHYDRLVNGPTSDVWIFPWVSLLLNLGVNFQFGMIVKSMQADPKTGMLTSVTLQPQGGAAQVILKDDHFDYGVSAIPVDGMQALIKTGAIETVLESAPILRGLENLETRWMNGVQYYLKEDVPVVHGHALFVDTPWALTCISQRQFWSQCEMTSTGDGQARGVLSVDISEWTKKGILIQKKACDCTHDEIAEEVWAELKASLNIGGKVVLDDANLCGFFMDDCINLKRVDPEASDAKSKNPYGPHVNLEPLFINTVGSLALRPHTDIGMKNFFLASDYVRTHTDLASMEAANESGRRAANAVLAASGSTAAPAAVWPLNQPWYVRPWQALDRWRFQRGLPHIWSDKNMRYQPPPDQSKKMSAAAS